MREVSLGEGARRGRDPAGHRRPGLLRDLPGAGRSDLQRRRARAVARASRSCARRSPKRTSASPKQIQQAAAEAIDLLLRGGNLGMLGAPSNLIGLEQIPGELRQRDRPHAARPRPRSARTDRAVRRTSPRRTSSVSKRVLATVGQPIKIAARVLVTAAARRWTRFAVVVAVTVSLMFLGVLLAAGGIALEREEHALARLIRGLVSREALLLEKGLLAAACSFLVALAMLAGRRRVRLARLGPLRAVAARRWRCGALAFAALGRGDRRARARGPGGLAARLPAPRCRWPSSRSSRPARSGTASTT